MAIFEPGTRFVVFLLKFPPRLPFPEVEAKKVMRVRSSVENRFQEAALTEARGYRPADRSRVTGPVTPEPSQAGALDAPVEGSKNAKLEAKSGEEGASPRVMDGREKARVARESERPSGFTQDAEGTRPSRSFDRLDISTNARRLSAEEGRRAASDASNAVASQAAKPSPAMTATLASTLDLRV